MRRSRCARRRSVRTRLSITSLEDRSTPATLTVTTAADSGPGSLRQAILDANGTATEDTIVFDATLAGQTIVLGSTLPTINTPLTITGLGANQLAVSGNHAVRVLRIASGAVVTISDVTIKDGRSASDAGGTSDGGGIANSGTLNLTRSTVSGNQVPVGTPTQMTGLTARGGGLYNSGTATVAGCTFSFNQAAPVDGPTALGGGIFNSGTLTVINSTFAANQAVSIIPSSMALGGAIFNEGTATILQSTLANNVARSGGGSGFLRAGGVFNNGGASVGVANSVIAGNNAASDVDVFGTFTSQGHNLIGSTSGSSGWVASDLLNLAPQLGPLAGNGGTTQTLAPLTGSPVINAGGNDLVPSGLTTDQRGPGFVRVYGPSVDIGSVEDQPPWPPTGTAAAPNVGVADEGQTSYMFEVVYDDPTGQNNGIDVSTVIDNDNAVRVTGPNGFDVPATFTSIDDPTDGSPRTVTYSITPPGGSWDGPDFGTYTVRVQPDQVRDVDGNAVPDGQIGSFTVTLPQTFVVTNANDGGAGSLREAITQANSFSPRDTITFDPSYFGSPRTISLLTALPQISSEGGGLTIAGPGASLLTVRRAPTAGNLRVFDSAAPTLTMTGFTVSGGVAASSYGGGLYASGNVTLDRMIFTNNTATSTSTTTGCGGAVFMRAGGFLKVLNSTIAGNTAGLDGGGIGWAGLGGGSLVVENSTISGNSTTYTGTNRGYYGGGGIYFSGTINNSPPAGFTPGTVVIRNSTIANNTSAGSGGGVFMDRINFGSTLLVENSTVTGNSAATSGNSGSPYFEPFGGGGLQRNSHLGTFVIANSVVAGNVNASAPDIGSEGTVNVNYSAIGSTAGFTPTGGNNLVGQDLKLGPLADNGGPTPTMAPLAGSPLLNAGSDALVPGGVTTDQRGLARIALGGVDIGSFEAQPLTVTIDQGAGQADPTNGATITFDVAFSEPVTGFTAADVDLSASTVGGTVGRTLIQTGPTTYTVAVNVAGATPGTVVASIPADAVASQSGIGNLASTSTDNAVTYDTLAPAVTIDQGAGQADPTSGATITFDVAFSEPVTGFAAADVDLSASTAFSGPPNVTVTPTGPATYTVIVTGMTISGSVVASIPAGAVTDAAGNPNAASTSTDNSVSFLGPGVLSIAPPAVTRYAEGAEFDLVVTRTGGSQGEVRADLQAVAGTAHANDFTATVTGPPLVWGDGDTTDRTIHVKIEDDTANEGRESFRVELAAPAGGTGGARLGAAVDLSIDPSDGTVVDGTSRKPSFTFNDTDGDRVTVRLGGRVGSLTVYLDDPDGDGSGPIDRLTVAGTDALPGTRPAAAVTVTVVKPRGGTGDGFVSIGGVTGSSLRAFTAPRSDLVGDGFNMAGFVGSVTVRDVSNGADIRLDGARPTATSAVRLTARQIGDGTDVTVAAPIGTLQAWNYGDGTITAPSIGRMTLTGNVRALVSGDLKGDITLDGSVILPLRAALNALTVAGSVADTATVTAPSVGTLTVRKDLAGDVTVSGANVAAGKPALKALRVIGAVTGSTIDVSGSITAVTAGTFVNSRLYAGYNAALGTFPVAATVGSFRVTGRTNGFANSYLYATQFDTVTLASVVIENGPTPFGVYANDLVKALTIGAPAFRYNPLDSNPQGPAGGDFEVVIVP